jgi:hypothetical protein
MSQGKDHHKRIDPMGWSPQKKFLFTRKFLFKCYVADMMTVRQIIKLHENMFKITVHPKTVRDHIYTYGFERSRPRKKKGATGEFMWVLRPRDSRADKQGRVRLQYLVADEIQGKKFRPGKQVILFKDRDRLNCLPANITIRDRINKPKVERDLIRIKKAMLLATRHHLSIAIFRTVSRKRDALNKLAKFLNSAHERRGLSKGEVRFLRAMMRKDQGRAGSLGIRLSYTAWKRFCKELQERYPYPWPHGRPTLTYYPVNWDLVEQYRVGNGVSKYRVMKVMKVDWATYYRFQHYSKRVHRKHIRALARAVGASAYTELVDWKQLKRIQNEKKRKRDRDETGRLQGSAAKGGIG